MQGLMLFRGAEAGGLVKEAKTIHLDVDYGQAFPYFVSAWALNSQVVRTHVPLLTIEEHADPTTI